ncbi:hypothetical protein LXA43DRAFT_1063372 [Ganoderma leucocontextum]|nr:hypothetical protein LXA43DRAFT_1063372 [Ganoderma leucocontextum]
MSQPSKRNYPGTSEDPIAIADREENITMSDVAAQPVPPLKKIPDTVTMHADCIASKGDIKSTPSHGANTSTIMAYRDIPVHNNQLLAAASAMPMNLTEAKYRKIVNFMLANSHVLPSCADKILLPTGIDKDKHPRGLITILARARELPVKVGRGSASVAKRKTSTALGKPVVAAEREAILANRQACAAERQAAQAERQAAQAEHQVTTIERQVDDRRKGARSTLY